MKNTINDLNNILFEQIERINDDELKGEALKDQLNKAKAINSLATTLVQNGVLMLKSMEFRDAIGEVPETTPRFLSNEK